MQVDPALAVFGFLVLAIRGAVAVAILTVLAGGLPRIVQIGLAVTFGSWSAIMVIEGPAPLAVADLVVIAAREAIIGATIGIVGVMPLLAAATAGRLVDTVGSTGASVPGPYSALFGVLAAAVFVGIDGHVATAAAIVESHRAVPALGEVQPRVLDAIGSLVGNAARLAIPWLVTAAVVELAVGIGGRLAGRAALALPGGTAVPSALAMMTASLVTTLAVAMAALMRGAL